MIAFIKRLFGIAEADLNIILADFNKLIVRLETNIEYHGVKATEHAVEAQRHQEAAKAHDAQIFEAATIQANLKKLLNK